MKTHALTVDIHAYLDRFFEQYIETALWSSIISCGEEAHQDGGDCPKGEDCLEGRPMDYEFNSGDFGHDVEAELLVDARDFVASQWRLLRGLDAGQCGHDFWLTRNGHGAGFWDRGYGDLGDELTSACDPYGSCDLYVGDDGKVYAS